MTIKDSKVLKDRLCKFLAHYGMNEEYAKTLFAIEENGNLYFNPISIRDYDNSTFRTFFTNVLFDLNFVSLEYTTSGILIKYPNK